MSDVARHFIVKHDLESFQEMPGFIWRINLPKGKYAAHLKQKEDDRPVALLCWVDSDTDGELRESVPQLRIFELHSLLRNGKKIEWH